MWIAFDSPAVRLTGRVGRQGGKAAATAAGSTIEAAFCGELATLRFDLQGSEHPYPHVWIAVDGGPRIEAPLNPYLRVIAAGDGPHVVQVIYKGAVEQQARWQTPLVGKIAFLGLEARAEGELPEDNRKCIEFVGDSITEGVLIDDFCRPFPGEDQPNRPSQDDVTATYAWRTAEALHLRPLMMGYGAVGVTQGGCGGVPQAADAYPYCFEGMPVTGPEPDYVLINHGANDRRQTVGTYITGYRLLLDRVYARCPHAKVIVLSAFCGVYPEELKTLVETYNRENGRDILFIDSAGWIPPEPLHPRRDGHRIVADHLTAILREKLGL